MKPREEWSKRCTWHCAACDAHFVSVEAFDRHRPGGECAEDPAAVVSAKGRQRLEVCTHDGYCRLMTGSFKDGKLVKERHPVVIYQPAQYPVGEQETDYEQPRLVEVGE